MPACHGHHKNTERSALHIDKYIESVTGYVKAMVPRALLDYFYPPVDRSKPIKEALGKDEKMHCAHHYANACISDAEIQLILVNQEAIGQKGCMLMLNEPGTEAPGYASFAPPCYNEAHGITAYFACLTPEQSVEL